MANRPLVCRSLHGPTTPDARVYGAEVGATILIGILGAFALIAAEFRGEATSDA
jgi:hypothetical protein